jgi:hypothetical protein
VYGRDVSRESFVPDACFEDLASGFVIEARRGEPMSCHDVRGFDEALIAARDPLAPAPLRLVLVDTAARERESACAWLDAWAEDTEQVRRSFVIRRAIDGAEIAVVATLASHGFGVPTSLALESVREREGGDILRSGVHLKIDVARALARGDAWGTPEPG